MTTLTATLFSGPSLRSRFETFRTEMSAKAAKRKVYHTTLKELEQCSARDLHELRIARSSIQQIAHEAAYGA